MPQPLLALLHGINVGGHRKVPMAELRSLAQGLGYTEVRTYIASGNLLLETEVEPHAVEAALEAAIAGHFGFAVAVTVRTAEQWRQYAQGSPFADAETERSNLLMLGLAKLAVNDGAATVLAEYVQGDERFALGSDCVWIDYAQGSARSRIAPKILERALCGPVTTRNWRSVLKLAELLQS